MNLLYSIPLTALFIVILGSCCALGLGGVWLVRKMNWMVDREDNDAIVLTHAFAGVLYAVALGLLVVNVQSGYTEVKLVAMHEANLVEDLYISAQGLSEEIRDEIQVQTLAYLDAVIDEWPNISDSPDSELPSHDFVESLTITVLNYDPESDQDSIIFAQVFGGLNEMLDLRRERLHLGRDGVGSVTWFVVAIGALITIGMTWFYQTNSPRTHYGLVSLMSIMFGLMVFLIVSMDYPLLGKFSVDSTPFQESLADMNAWAIMFDESN